VILWDYNPFPILMHSVFYYLQAHTLAEDLLHLSPRLAPREPILVHSCTLAGLGQALRVDYEAISEEQGKWTQHLDYLKIYPSLMLRKRPKCRLHPCFVSVEMS
jgi:hypothetical protein